MAVLAPLLVPTVAARADTAAVVEYPVPHRPLRVDAIVKGPDGNMWFTESNSQKVARITPAGVITEFAVAGHPAGITVGPDNNLWFIEGQDQLVGRMSPDGTVLNQFPVPWLLVPYGPLAGITLGPDNHVWISEVGANMVGWIDATGVVTAYAVNGGPLALTPGPDGNLWFTEWRSNRIAKLDPATGRVLARYDVPRPSKFEGGGLADIVTGADGNLWFTVVFEDKVGRITPQGEVTLFPLPTSNAGAIGITVGPDGNVWFAESTGNRIGRITPAGVVTEVHVPTPASRPFDIATGPDGNLWFTEAFASQIGKLDPSSLVPRPPPCLVVTHSLTLSSDVGPCPGTGIVVTADNLTLDLNGHKVFSAPGPRFGDFAGIRLAGVSGVTVSNGSVTGFDAGVALDGGSENTITRLNVHDNIGVADSAATFGDGIVLFDSSANQLVNNVVKHNGVYDGIGVLGIGSNNNTIQANRVTDTTDKGFARSEGEGTGIILNPFLSPFDPRRGESLSGNNIIDNVVRDNVDSGISNLSNVDGIIRGNTVVHNGFRPDGTKGNDPGNGIGVQHNQKATPNTHNIIESNQVSDNFNDGIVILSHENRIASNTVTANHANGIEISFPFYAKSNRIVNNTSTGNVLLDLLDRSPECGTNVWMGNVWSGSTSPPCTQAGGHQVQAPAATSQAVGQAEVALSPTPGQDSSAPVGRTRTALAADTVG